MAKFPAEEYARLVIILLRDCAYRQGDEPCKYPSERAHCPSHQILADEGVLFRLLRARGRVELLRFAEQDPERWDQLQVLRVAEARLTENRRRAIPRPGYTG